MSRLLTAREVAEQFGVCVTTVLRWTRAGTLPAIRLPSGQIRYRAEQLDAWLEQRATQNREALTADGATRPQTLPSSALAAVTTEE